MVPIVGGAVLLFFFVMPFLFRRRQPQVTYPLRRSENPAVFALIDAVARHVGAPSPMRVNASLDNSIRVANGDDDKTEVTLGLPLVAVCTARQTAGYLAHEFFKHSKQPSAKCWSFASTIRGLFARAAYDTGDDEQVVADWGGIRRRPAVVTFGFVPWMFERMAAKCGSAIKKGMVLDADRCQVRIAGSNTFAMTQLDRRLLDEIAALSRDGFTAAERAGQRIENLPAFYANKLKILKSEQPKFVKRICQDLMTRADQAKPSLPERIALAQQYKHVGTFPIDKTSALLFKDFTRLCRQVTAHHYDTHFPARTDAAQLNATDAANGAAVPNGMATATADHCRQPSCRALPGQCSSHHHVGRGRSASRAEYIARNSSITIGFPPGSSLPGTPLRSGHRGKGHFASDRRVPSNANAQFHRRHRRPPPS